MTHCEPHTFEFSSLEKALTPQSECEECPGAFSLKWIKNAEGNWEFSNKTSNEGAEVGFQCDQLDSEGKIKELKICYGPGNKSWNIFLEKVKKIEEDWALKHRQRLLFVENSIPRMKVLLL